MTYHLRATLLLLTAAACLGCGRDLADRDVRDAASPGTTDATEAGPTRTEGPDGRTTTAPPEAGASPDDAASGRDSSSDGPESTAAAADPHYGDTGSLVASGNLYRDFRGQRETFGTTFFDPSALYAYKLDPAENLQALLDRCAGPRPELGL